MKNCIRKVHDFLLDKDRLGLELNWIKKIWYIVLLLASSVYVICNYNDIVDESLLNRIDARCLIFILWLILLVLPLFESFEGFGVRVSRNSADQRQLTEDIKNMTNHLIDDKINPIDTKEIEERFNQLDK